MLWNEKEKEEMYVVFSGYLCMMRKVTLYACQASSALFLQFEGTHWNAVGKKKQAPHSTAIHSQDNWSSYHSWSLKFPFPNLSEESCVAICWCLSLSSSLCCVASDCMWKVGLSQICPFKNHKMWFLPHTSSITCLRLWEVHTGPLYITSPACGQSHDSPRKR